MKFEQIKEGIKLKLVKQKAHDGRIHYTDYGYKIGDVVKVTYKDSATASIERLRDGETGYCIPKDITYTDCWEPTGFQTLKEVFE